MRQGEFLVAVPHRAVRCWPAGGARPPKLNSNIEYAVALVLITAMCAQKTAGAAAGSSHTAEMSWVGAGSAEPSMSSELTRTEIAAPAWAVRRPDRCCWVGGGQQRGAWGVLDEDCRAVPGRAEKRENRDDATAVLHLPLSYISLVAWVKGRRTVPGHVGSDGRDDLEHLPREVRHDRCGKGSLATTAGG